jgi:hypothetical protein
MRLAAPTVCHVNAVSCSWLSKFIYVEGMLKEAPWVSGIALSRTLFLSISQLSVGAKVTLGKLPQHDRDTRAPFSSPDSIFQHFPG